MAAAQLTCGVPGQHCRCEIAFQNKLAKTTSVVARANLQRAGAQPQFDSIAANRQLTAAQVALLNVGYGYGLPAGRDGRVHHSLHTCCKDCVKYIRLKENRTATLSVQQRADINAQIAAQIRAARLDGRGQQADSVAAMSDSDDGGNTFDDTTDDDAASDEDEADDSTRSSLLPAVRRNDDDTDGSGSPSFGDGTWRRVPGGCGSKWKQIARGATTRGNRGVTHGLKLCDMSARRQKERLQQIVDAVGYLTQEGKTPSGHSLNLLGQAWGGYFVSDTTGHSLDKSFHHSKRHWEEERRHGVNKSAPARRYDRRGRWRVEHADVRLVPEEHLPPGFTVGHAVYVDFKEALQIVVDAHAKEDWFEGTSDLIVAECADGCTAGEKREISTQLGSFKILNDVDGICSPKRQFTRSLVIGSEKKHVLLPIFSFLDDNRKKVKEIFCCGQMRKVVFAKNQDEKGMHISKNTSGNSSRFFCAHCTRHRAFLPNFSHRDDCPTRVSPADGLGKYRTLIHDGCQHIRKDGSCHCESLVDYVVR